MAATIACLKAATLTDPIAVLLAEIEAGDGLTMGAAARALGGVDPSTVFRFVRRGSKDACGEIVKLSATRIGAKWWTTRGSISRWVRALANPAKSQPEVKSTLKQKSNASARLEALGC